jgi:hypothetical protein
VEKSDAVEESDSQSHEYHTHVELPSAEPSASEVLPSADQSASEPFATLVQWVRTQSESETTSILGKGGCKDLLGSIEAPNSLFERLFPTMERLQADVAGTEVGDITKTLQACGITFESFATGFCDLVNDMSADDMSAASTTSLDEGGGGVSRQPHSGSSSCRRAGASALRQPPGQLSTRLGPCFRHSGGHPFPKDKGLMNLDHSVFGDARTGFKAFAFCQHMEVAAGEFGTAVTWNEPFPFEEPAWLNEVMMRLAPTDRDMKKYIRQVGGPHTLGVTVKAPIDSMKVPQQDGRSERALISAVATLNQSRRVYAHKTQSFEAMVTMAAAGEETMSTVVFF